LDFVKVERGDDGIAVLTIDRQKKLNSLNPQVVEEIREALLDLEDDPPRVTIVTGAGEKAFVAGANIAVMNEMSPWRRRVSLRLATRRFL
jgi:enoyl-CoA hydratase